MSDGAPPTGNSIELPAIPPFDLTRVVRSHGWSALPPFRWNEGTETLSTSCELDGIPTTIEMRQVGPATVQARWSGTAADRRVALVVSRMLRLSEDLSEFRRRCRRRRGLRHVAEDGLGRLLRCPSPWEDAVKVLCTTNVNWAGTKSMAERLVSEFGAVADDGRRCFPGPRRILDAGSEALLTKARMGYRAARLIDFASSVLDKRIDPHRWDDHLIDSDQIRREIRGIKGFGDYATATIMALTGRYDFVPIDSAYMEFVTRWHFNGTKPTRREAEAVYESWGRWKHLAYWFQRFDD